MTRMHALTAAVTFGLSASLCQGGTALAQEASPQPDKPKQVLIVSFDGAGNNDLWEKSRGIASRTGARFTYFLSCTHLIPWAEKASYQGPKQKQGRSNVGFAASPEDAAKRLDHIWKARQEGHEIASHACGHFDGKDWTSADWTHEFETYDRVLTNAWKANGVGAQEPAGWAEFVRTGITGFRAPYLSQDEALKKAELAKGFAYDASDVTQGPAPVDRSDSRLARFSLPTIPEGPKSRRIIAMDYNLFVRHSVAIETPSRSAEFEERSYAAFKAAFDAQYDGTRIPLQIGFHFVEMNGGAYWRAMERLLTEVCHRSDVACIGYAEALALDTKKPAGMAGSSSY